MYKSDYTSVYSDRSSDSLFYPGSYLRVISPTSSSLSSPDIRVRNLVEGPSLDTFPISSTSVTQSSNPKLRTHSFVHPTPSTLRRHKHILRVSSKSTDMQHPYDMLPAVMHGQTNRHTESLPWTVDLGDDSEFSLTSKTRKRTVRQASDPMLFTSTDSIVPPRPIRNVSMVFGSRAGCPIRRTYSVPVTHKDDGRHNLPVGPNCIPSRSPPMKYSITPAPSVTGSSTIYLLLPQNSTLPHMPVEESESSCSEDGSCLSVSPLPTTPFYHNQDEPPRLRSSSSTNSISSTSICLQSPRDEDDKDLFGLVADEQDDGFDRPIETFLSDIDDSPTSIWPDEAGQIMLLPPVPLKSQKRVHKHIFGVST